MELEGVTFASLLTPQGVVIAAALTTTLITLLKNSIPQVGAVSGALLAFVITFALYVLAGVATGVNTLDAGLVVFMAWLSCATSAVGIHSTVRTTNVAVQKRRAE